MNEEQLHKMREGAGFIAALDQSGGSTPKALKLYGIPEGSRLKRRSIPILCALGGLCVQSVPSPIDFPEHHVQ